MELIRDMSWLFYEQETPFSCVFERIRFNFKSPESVKILYGRLVIIY